MTFGVMWGYPFLTVGSGAVPGDGRRPDAGAIAVAALVYGVTLGSVLARHPYYRSLIAIGVVERGHGDLGGRTAVAGPRPAVAARGAGAGACRPPRSSR